METAAVLEKEMQDRVLKIQQELDLLLVIIGERISISTQSEGYYWDNCRDIVIALKNQANRLTEWVRP